jgi:hypothetical protein
MARIEHRRMVRRSPGSWSAAPPGASDLVDDDDAAADGAGSGADVARGKPFASLDNLTWFGWLMGLVAFAWLVFNIRPLFHAGAFSPSERTDDIVTLVQAIAAMAALALPAGIERGAAKARRRAPRLYLAAVLLAAAEAATIGVQWVRTQPLADVDVSDPTQPIVLAYIFLSLVPVLLSMAGLVALILGVWDLGAPRARRLLAAAGVVAAFAYLLTYGPYLDQLFSPDAMLVSGLNFMRVVVSLLLIGTTAAAGVALLSGAVANLTPRVSWVLAGLAGACYFLSALGRVIIGAPISQDLLVTASWIVFGLESAAPAFLLLAFATGLARTVDLPSPAPRRLVARWVRYPAA